jgi:hypothetical protein
MTDIPDLSDVTWKSPSWDDDTLLTVLLPGGGVLWRDDDSDEWHLDPAGSVPAALRPPISR